MKKLSLLFVILIIFSVKGFSQNYLKQSLRSYQNPNELITLSPTLSYNQAIALLNKVSQKVAGKGIISTVSIDSAIGLQIQNMNYMKALTLLVKMEGLFYDETPDNIVIKKSNIPAVKRTKDNYVPVNAREVRISAVFFEEDVDKARQRGIDWKTAFSKAGLGVGGKIGTPNTNAAALNAGSGSSSTSSSSGSKVETPEFTLNASSSFNLGNVFGTATAIFKYFETLNIGQIISSPNITVLDGTKARLQDGQDLAIKQRDFSGNIIENFYSIGSIVNVTPHVITEDGINYILLDINVQRSSFVPDPNNTIINKTSATTKVVMLNGEETVIGGMFINQTTQIRKGIPFLKDLPWWVFGLRYIFGSTQNEVIKKELVILIKVNLVPTLKERIAQEYRKKNVLQEELKDQRDRINNYKKNQSQSDDK